MGLLDCLVPEAKAGNWADRAWEMLLRGPAANSGARVNTRTALGVSTVLSCCRVLAEGIAQVPFQLLQEDEDGRKRKAKDHPVYKLLWRRPNDWMTSFEFRETMMYHALLAKGGFAIINRVGGEIVELIPVLPDTVTPRQGTHYQLSYIVRLPDGSELEVPRQNMFVLRGPSWDGFQGMEMIDLAREAIGLAIATEENHARFHANGAKTAGLISMAGTLSDAARAQLKKSFEESTLKSNAYRTIVLDNGAKYERMAMSGVDSQHIETRRMQVEEICRGFRVFPQMVGFSGNTTTTYASAEQFFSAHVIHSLGPWAERWEQAADRDLLSEAEKDGGHYTKLHLRGLQRGDAAARSAYYKSGIVDGWLTRNEARAEEELDPIDGLDEPLIPLNMAEAGKAASATE